MRVPGHYRPPVVRKQITERWVQRDLTAGKPALGKTVKDGEQ